MNLDNFLKLINNGFGSLCTLLITTKNITKHYYYHTKILIMIKVYNDINELIIIILLNMKIIILFFNFAVVIKTPEGTQKD